jgi:spermidine synthase
LELTVESEQPVRLSDVKVVEIVPVGKLGRAEIKHHTVSTMEAWQAARHGQRSLAGEQVAQLYVDGKLVMSDSVMERVSNFEVCHKAKGDVLVAGLGVGMILKPLLTNPLVTSVTVIEECQDVIDLVAPYYAHPKLKVAQGDIYKWRPARGVKYDAIYFDVWADIMSTNLTKMAQLHQAFKYYKRSPDAWMNSWNREYLLDRKRRGY